MNVLIIDDEPVALKVLEEKLNKFFSFKKIHLVSDWDNILPTIRKEKLDLIFLDINLGEYNGLELAEIINNEFTNIKIVFVTAYGEYAVKAFELNAIDYLLKPVTNKRLKILESKLSRNEEKNIEQNSKTTNFVCIKVLDQIVIKNFNNHEVLFRTQKAQELFFLLWHFQQEGLKRDEIIEYLWPDANLDQGVTLFHTTMYQLRATFSKLSYQNPVNFKNKLYKLTIEVKSDYAKMQLLLEERITEINVKKMLMLYKNKYFEKEGYSWSLYCSNQVDIKVKKYLLNTFKKNKVSKGLAEEIIESKFEEFVFDEEWLCTVIKYLYKTGQKNKMISIYERASKLWIEELGLEIPSETKNIYFAQ